MITASFSSVLSKVRSSLRRAHDVSIGWTHTNGIPRSPAPSGRPARRLAARWTTVALIPTNSAGLRQALALNAEGPGGRPSGDAPTRGRSRWSAPRLRRGSAQAGHQQHLACLPGEEVDRFVDLAERHTV